ncbi:hypothetical protein BZG35_09255 [Brevundimonas sp. LM2]|nr:hypothetical protein BZG35_09255 [Brevundimonas sp. LM2]
MVKGPIREAFMKSVATTAVARRPAACASQAQQGPASQALRRGAETGVVQAGGFRRSRTTALCVAIKLS